MCPYTVKPVNPEEEAFTVKAAQLSRRKNVLSQRETEAAFQTTREPQNGAIGLKASSVSKFGLLDLNFTQFFPDEPPVFSPALTPPPGARPDR
ncbi:hypothetical protein WMY93_033844 [Mugilogobius chulae]|uniref:Uncharacterized protein n=1 Tax=Mugilogobius chulae TaxID=88201 RepID=A0AAW0MMN3_9GOBI